MTRNGIFFHIEILRRSLDECVDKACDLHFHLLRRNGIFFHTEILPRSLDGRKKYRSLDDFFNSKKNVSSKTKVSGLAVMFGQPSRATCAVL